MVLRVIFIADSDGTRWAFAYLVADEPGIDFELIGDPEPPGAVDAVELPV